MWVGQLHKNQGWDHGDNENFHVVKQGHHTYKQYQQEIIVIQLCGDPNHWYYECLQMYDKERAKLSATKEKGGRDHTQISEMV